MSNYYVHINKLLLVMSCFFFAKGSISAQVTIGSSSKPAYGAILDLKQKEADDPGGITSYKGLLLPRVHLHDISKLQIGTASDLPSSEYAAHAGLIVYNVNEEDNLCKGVYLWTGSEWQYLQGECLNGLFSITVSPSYTDGIFLASGQSGNIISPSIFDISWNPETGTANWASTGIQFTASPNSPWTTTPQNGVEFIPVAMTLAEVDPSIGNPFLTKTGELIFTVSYNGETRERRIQLNQTNKTITLATPIHDKPVSGIFANTLKSNGKWKIASITPDDNNIATISDIKLNGVNLNIGTEIDWNRNDNEGTGTTGNLTYNITTDASRSRYTQVLFEDASIPKRFDDVILAIYQCSNIGINPTMSEWASIAGFGGVKEPGDRNTSATEAEKEDIAVGINTPHPVTGIAWHRDQDGNIFLSSDFGSAGRWMITNLAAKNFVPTGSRTGIDETVVTEISGPIFYLANNTPHWVYPGINTNGADATKYSENPRAGLLYNWAGATNVKTLTGNEFNDYPNHNRRQGICPNGWHLPSDWEFTQLENELRSQTSTYSSSPDMGGVPYVNTATVETRANLGIPMKEQCELSYNSVTGLYYTGTSNPIGTAQISGPNYIMTGYGGTSQSVGYSSFGYLMTSSASSSSFMWVRNFNATTNFVDRVNLQAVRYTAVRCKQDTP